MAGCSTIASRRASCSSNGPIGSGSALPTERLDVRIDGGADEPRTLDVAAHGPSHERYLAAARAIGAVGATS